LNVSAASWLLILLAVLAANLPFFNERCFALVALQRFPKKTFFLRLTELIVLYFALGALAFTLESITGNRFYAITVCLFVVMAFPGFVYRYLKK
jgi:hypothetical protein